MQDYHRLIVEDDALNIPAARRALKRARRRMWRASQWGVRLDQLPARPAAQNLGNVSPLDEIGPNPGPQEQE